jgi:hypothetical protein
MKPYFSQWPAAWKNRQFRITFWTTLAFLAVTLFILPRFLAWVELRQGVVLPDPVLEWFSPVDLTWLIFSLIYIGLIVAVLSLLRRPDRLIIALQGYTLLVWFRIGAMYLVPLEPPAVTIPLQDPFVQLFGSGHVLMKDLFFSGHTSTLFLLYLTAWHPVLKKLFLACVVTVAIAVVIHHTHYTIDVYVAPFFSYASYRIVTLLNERIFAPRV